ncbi:Calcium-activated chloride channel regulator 1 [Lamellibrachia satsuma]|nr:Calcium-activated chloride channel regulator 1 [Lamellibrachia satsuma]
MSSVATTVAVLMSVLLVADLSLAYTKRNEIKLVNNGYEGILIAIGESVPASDSEEMIRRIKFFFKKASDVLFQATDQRVYFRSITILVPKSWGNTSYDAATNETFSSANIVIDGPNVETPTTWAYKECGQPGEYIQLPIGYMLASLSTVVDTFGYPGPTIVHEWGHLRWGLRDEYPVPGKDKFYHSDGAASAVKCGKYMRGSIVDHVTGGECELVHATGLPTTSCYFKPHSDPYVHASLMFYHNVTEVTTFCDNDTNNPKTLHNDEAPNVHNKLCNGRSAWEIMRDHDDFRNGSSPAITKSQKSDPTFRIVQAKSKRIVMILDVFGSMGTESNGVKRIDKLYQTSADYVKNIIPKGYSVGIVTFSDVASTVATLREVNSEGVRDELVTKLPKGTGGGTGIGRGLLRGVEVLETGGRSASGGVLVVVTDGKENVEPSIDKVKPTILKKGVIVHTILISAQAEKKLIELAAFTNGESFFDSGLFNSTNLQSALRSTVKDSENDAPGVAPVELLLETVSVSSRDEINRSVSIDSSIGRDTEFTFTYTGSTLPLDVLVTSPSGLEYTTVGPNGRHDTANKQVKISLNETEVGRWTVVMRNAGSADTEIQLLVTSKASSDDSYPIRVRAFLSDQHINFTDPSTLKLIIRAEVKKGYSPVIGAKVEAQVGMLSWKLMEDDGLGVDVLKDDGFYSAVLLKFPHNGYNPVKVRAAAKDGNETRLVNGAGNRAFQPFPVNGSEILLDLTYESVDGLDRTADAGVDNVANMDLNVDPKAVYPFPPAKVTDLKVTGMSYENETVTLQWTSVGAYEEQETASSYDIHFSTYIKQLRYSIEDTSRFNESDIFVGNLTSPMPPSETEKFVIHFPAGFNNKTLFFGLKVIHSNTDRVSDVSNIVSAAIVYVPPKSPPTTTSQPDHTTWEPTTAPGDTTTSVTTTIGPHHEPQTPTTPTTPREPTSRNTTPTPSTTDSSVGIFDKIKLAIEIVVVVMFLIATVALVLLIRKFRNKKGTTEETNNSETELSNITTEDLSAIPRIPRAILNIPRPRIITAAEAIAATRMRRSLPPSEGPPLKDAQSAKLPCFVGRVSDDLTDFNDKSRPAKRVPKTNWCIV